MSPDPNEPSVRITCAATEETAAALAKALAAERFFVVQSPTVHPRGLIAVGGILQPAGIPIPEPAAVALFDQAARSWDEGKAQSQAPALTWARVVDVRSMLTTGIELWVRDDNDASAQLDLLAPVMPKSMNLNRDAITIQPPPGWQNYGDHRLVNRYRGRAG